MPSPVSEGMGCPRALEHECGRGVAGELERKGCTGEAAADRDEGYLRHRKN
jgi:hypothetical protein